MSTPERQRASHSASPPFQSGQPQRDGSYDEEELLTSSLELSPRSRDDSGKTKVLEDALSKFKADDDVSSGKLYTPDRHALQQIDRVLSSSFEDNDITTSPPSRPNRYRGPLSTWRNWTAAERDLAISLQQLIANDLSVHLYNVFHLKASTRKLSGQGTETHTRDLEHAEKWVPPKVWTAWPLPPEIVPRGWNVSSWDEEGVRRQRYHGKRDTTSHVLKELLVGYVLKKSKERFWEREREDEESKTQNVKSRRRSGKSKGDSEGLDPSSHDNEHTWRVNTSSAHSEAGDDDGQSQIAQTSPQAERATSPSDRHSDHLLNNLVPAVMVDDDRASDILKPTMHHVLARFDSLLMGLHHARNAYITQNDSASEIQKDVDEVQQSSQGKRKRNKSRQRRDRPRIYNESTAESEIDNPADLKPSSLPGTHSHQIPSSRRKARRSRDPKTRIGLRNWSDVLGIASMTGWEPAVLERAATRCAALFEEGISFRTLREGNDTVEEVSYLPGIYRQPEIRRMRKRFSERNHDSNGIDIDDRLVGAVPMDAFLQPIEAEKHWKRNNKKSRHSGRLSPQSREE